VATKRPLIDAADNFAYQPMFIYIDAFSGMERDRKTEHEAWGTNVRRADIDDAEITAIALGNCAAFAHNRRRQRT
jgi:hypothetical protein